MGTISEKLTYLNTTKQKIKQGINSLGGKITNDTTFRDYAAELDSVYNKLPNVTGTGTGLSLSPTLEARLGLIPKGNMYQESTTGKNLFKSIPSGTKNGITFTNNGDGSYTLNGTATSNSSFYLTNIGYSAGTYTLSANNPESLNDISYLQLETSGGNKRVALSQINTSNTFEVNDINVLTIVVGNGTVCNNFIIRPQLEVGSSATSFEPYTNGQASPSPDYTQMPKVVTGENEVKVENKNLWDGTYPNIANETVKYRSIYVGEGTFTMSSNIPLTPNNRFANLFFLSGTVSTGASTGSNGVYENRSVTIQSENGYITVGYRIYENINPLNYETMIQKGATATDYVEHKEQNYPLSLSSKNLYKTPASKTVNGITYTLNEDGTYDISGTATARADTYIEGDISNFENGETYVLSANQYIPAGMIIHFEAYNGNTWVKHCLGDNNYLRNDNQPCIGTFNGDGGDRVRFTLRVATGTTLDLKGLGIQLEKNATATPFRQYGYSIKLLEIGDYVNEIHRTSGKNLLNPELIIPRSWSGITLENNNGKISFTGTNTSSSAIAFSLFDYQTGYITLKKGVTYNIRYITGQTPSVSSYRLDIREFHNAGNIYAYETSQDGITYTPTEDLKVQLQLRIAGSYTINTTGYIQIEEGSTATPYEPYGSDKWYLHKEIGKLVLDGTENWGTQNNIFVLNIDDIIQTPAYSFIHKIYLCCSHFLAQGTNYRTSVENLNIAKIIDGGNPKQIGINYSTLNNDVNAFKTFLQAQYNNDTPVIIYYVLVEPNDILINDTVLIEQLNALYYANSYDGETNISTSYETDNMPMLFTASALKGGE